jgi:hypothetical protein
MLEVHDLPALNAILNSCATVLLLTGYALIRSGRRDAHRNVMIAALVCSTLFLTSYLIYHAQVGSVRFSGHRRRPHALPLDPPHPHDPGGGRPGPGDHHGRSRLAEALGEAQAHRPLDAAHLALRIRDRRRRLLDAVSDELVRR